MQVRTSSGRRNLGVVLVIASLLAWGLVLQELPAGDSITALPDGGKVEPVVTAAGDSSVSRATPPAGSALSEAMKLESSMPPVLGTPVTGDENLRFARLVSVERGSAGRDTWHPIPCPSPGAQVGDPCDCDDDCCGLTSPDSCVLGECRANYLGEWKCEAVDSLQQARCDGDGDWCTEEWCDGWGTCVLLDDNGGGRLSVCAKECYGGSRDGLWCDVGSDCPGGICEIKPNGICDTSGGTNEEFCGVDMGSGYLGRCCDAGSCSYTLEGDCVGDWRRVADPDDMNHCWCPEYSSGIAPTDDEIDLAGRVIPSPKVCQVGGNRCEGDGSADCVDRCVSGPDAGAPCAADDDCVNSTCQPDPCVDDPAQCHDHYLNLGDDYVLASGYYLRLNEFRFRGGVENPGEIIVVEIYDSAYSPPKYVDAFAIQLPQAGIFTWTYEVDCWPDCHLGNHQQAQNPPVIIPPTGYVVIRSTREEDPALEANFWWGYTTTPADVGVNDPGKMWVDGDPEADLLGAGNNTMMFELVGQVLGTRADPFGACCIQDPFRDAQCEDTPRWGCGLCTDTEDEVIRCSQDRDCGVAAGVQRFCVFDNWFGPYSHNDFIPPQAGELCGDPPTPCDRGACCDDLDGNCTETMPEECVFPDEWSGAGTRCDPNCCPQPETGADCACDTYICATGAECYMQRLCSSTADPCDDALDCPIGDTCDPDFDGTPCTYVGPGQQGDCPWGLCGALFTGSQCEPENGDADCGTGETCELACTGPAYFDLQLPGEVQCIDQWTDPFVPPEPCTFGPAGDAYCDAHFNCLFPPCTCAFTPGDPVSYVFTGDSSKAFFSHGAGDECTLDNDDLGWYEGFVFTNQTGDPAYDCALITVDFCCSETVKTPVWATLLSKCHSGECITTGPMSDEHGTPMYGYGPGCGARHCCEDGNFAATFTVVDAYPALTTLTWQIFGAPICAGTTQGCLSDDDCDAGTQCLRNLGPYQGHFTIEPCPIAACCIEDAESCVETNRPQCEDELNGVWLGEGAVSYPVLDCEFAPCLFGACCLPPEQVPLGDPLCEDDQDHDTLVECKASTSDLGIYIGGVYCDDDPCPVCLMEDSDNCKPEDPAGGSIIQSDLMNNVRVADDFRPTDSSITKVCWSPGFLGPNGECAMPGQTPEDEWYITFYEDTGGGWPNDETGIVFPAWQLITVDAKVHRGGNSRVWDYSGRFDEVTVVPGECYWMEIQGTGSQTCWTYLTTGIETNAHSMFDAAYYGDYHATDARSDDFQFCLDCGITGSWDCGPYYRACCTCGDPPCEIKTRTECDELSPPGGFMLAETSCDPNPCPGIPPHNDCINAEEITGVEAAGEYGVRIDFNNVCATDDGPELGCGGGDMHFDIWYYYEGEACGDLTVSMCDLASFDTILAFYDGTGYGADPDLVCPVSHLGELDGCDPPLSGNDCCGDDTCNIDAGPSQLSMRIEEGNEVLIRIGGYYDAVSGQGDGKGWGAFDISLDTSVCPQGGDPPEPEHGGPSCAAGQKFCHFGDTPGASCNVDEDCPPNPGGMCWDDCWGDWSGASCIVYDHATGAGRCYIPRNRYLAIDPTVNSDPVAYHISLDTAADLDDQYAQCGVIEGFLSDPVCMGHYSGQPVDPQPPATDPCQGDGLFGWVSFIGSGPGTPRIWQEYPLYVTECEVVPAATYLITASEDGIDPNAGPGLEIMTSHEPSGDPQAQFWGDVTGGPGTVIPWMPPNSSCNLQDVTVLIMTWKHNPADPGPAPDWADLHPSVPNRCTTMADIQAVIEAFEGWTYPVVFVEPCECELRGAHDGGAFCQGDGSGVGVEPQVDELNNRMNGTGVLELEPVSATGPHAIADNDIYLYAANQEVTFELRLSGWGSAPGAPELLTYQATVDSSGYFSGAGDPLIPVTADVDSEHPEYVFGFLPPECMAIGAATPYVPDYKWEGNIFFGCTVADDGGTHYGGELIVNVPAGASGTYTIDLIPGACSSTMAGTELRDDIPVTLVPARIHLGLLPPGPEPGGTPCVTADDCTGIYAGADCVAGICYVPKNRYLSIDPTMNTDPVAYQVEIVEASVKECTGTADRCTSDLDCEPEKTCDPLYDPSGEGRTWWVDAPRCIDVDGNVDPRPHCNGGVNDGRWCMFDPVCQGGPHGGESCALDSQCWEDPEVPDVYYCPSCPDGGCDPNYCEGLLLFGWVSVLVPHCSGYPGAGRPCESPSTCMGGSSAGAPCTVDTDCPNYHECQASNSEWTEVACTPPDGPECEEGEDCSLKSPGFCLSCPDASCVDAQPAPRNWTEVPVHVTGCPIAPVITYAIRASTDGVSFSDPLVVNTIHVPAVPQNWADLSGGPEPGQPPWTRRWLPPDRTMSMADVGWAIRTFQKDTEETGFPPRVWTEMEIDLVINFGDIQFLLMAFEGKDYSTIGLSLIGVDPADCP